MGKKTRAQRNAIRKQGLKEYKQGWKTALKGTGQGLLGVAKGAVDGVTSGRDLASKVAGAVAQGAIQGAQAGSPNILKGAAMRMKGLAKAIFNDLQWYTNYPELMSGVGGANFNTDDSELFITSPTGSGSLESKALIATHFVTLTNGMNPKARDMVYTKIQQSLRRANSGATNYTEQHLNSYYMFIRSIVAMFASLRRAYGLVSRFTSLNLSVPASYMQALGFDYNDVKTNAADLRQYLNQTVEQLKVYVPVDLPILDRTEWMFSNLFKDSDDAKCQVHAFVLYEYPYINSTGSLAINTLNPTATYTVAQYTALLDTLIAQLKTVCPAATISGDMIKAFKLDRVLVLPTTDENYKVEPGYSEEVLTQIQNIVTPANVSVAMATDAFGYDYVKVVGTSVPGYTVSSGLPATFVRDMNTPIINFYKNEITPAEVVGATRLGVTVDNAISATSTNFEYYFGTEIISLNYNWFFSGSTLIPTRCDTYMHGISEAQFSYTAKTWSHIDWMQRVNMDATYYNSTGSQLYRSVTDIWDFNNYATSSFKNIKQCHDLAYESLFYVPSLVKQTMNVEEIK